MPTCLMFIFDVSSRMEVSWGSVSGYMGVETPLFAALNHKEGVQMGKKKTNN
jgi:hypothetical protein